MNRKLLDHLLHSGIIDATQLQSAMAKQRLSGADVLEILLRNRMVSEVDLARGLGSFYKYKVVDIAQVVPKADALERAEAEFCRRHQLLPFAIDRNTGDLLVAIADPSKAVGALDAFQAKTGLNIRPYVAPRFALGAAIDRAFDGASKSSFTGGRLQPVTREISSIGSVPAIADARQGSRGPVAGGRSSTPFASEDSFEPKRRGASNLFGTNDSSGLFGDAPARGPGASNLFGAREPAFGGGVASLDAVPPSREASGLRSDFGASGSAAAVSAAEIERLQRENEELRQNVLRLEASLQLEVNLLRVIVEMMLERGVLDRGTYLERVGRLR